MKSFAYVLIVYLNVLLKAMLKRKNMSVPTGRDITELQKLHAVVIQTKYTNKSTRFAF